MIQCQKGKGMCHGHRQKALTGDREPWGEVSAQALTHTCETAINYSSIQTSVSHSRIFLQFTQKPTTRASPYNVQRARPLTELWSQLTLTF